MGASKSLFTPSVKPNLLALLYSSWMKKQNTTLPERLQRVMAHLGLKPAEFARECGVQRQHVNGWLKGAKPQIESLRPLLERRGINPFWILYEDGEMVTPLFRIPPEARDLYEFVSSLSPDDARQCMEALKLLRASVAGHQPKPEGS